MIASFHSKGTIPSCSDMLNTCASGELICSTVSFSILGDIPSTPGDVISFILLILLATTSGFSTWNGLPEHIVNTESFLSFKKALRTTNFQYVITFDRHMQ